MLSGDTTLYHVMSNLIESYPEVCSFRAFKSAVSEHAKELFRNQKKKQRPLTGQLGIQLSLTGYNGSKSLSLSGGKVSATYHK